MSELGLFGLVFCDLQISLLPFFIIIIQKKYQYELVLMAHSMSHHWPPLHFQINVESCRSFLLMAVEWLWFGVLLQKPSVIYRPRKLCMKCSINTE